MENTSKNTPPTARFQFFPVSLFGSIFGFSGLTLAFKNATGILNINEKVTLALTLLTTLILLSVTAVYLLKIIKHRSSVIAEFCHPVAMNFFPAYTISLMLLSVLYIPIYKPLAIGLFYIGASGHVILTVYIMQTWLLHDKWNIQQMTPAWFIPIVGNIVAPIAVVNFAPMEISWFFFSIGLVFWFVLQVIVMYRLFFHPPMPKVLEPTLFILIAPPAIGFVSYQAMHPGLPLDGFARILYYTALFYTLLLGSQFLRFIKIPFAVSWWAYTFPLSAIASASFIMYEKLQINLFAFIGTFILAILSALVLYLTFKTLLAIKKKQLCVPPSV